jgi:hypothetical protein
MLLRTKTNAPPPERTDVTINIAIPRDLHRDLTLTAVALDHSLKDALIAAARQWVAANAATVAEVTAQLGQPHPGSRPTKIRAE